MPPGIRHRAGKSLIWGWLARFWRYTCILSLKAVSAFSKAVSAFSKLIQQFSNMSAKCQQNFAELLTELLNSAM
jgi:hypothetical protein